MCCNGELVFGPGAKTLDSFACVALRLEKRAVVLLEIAVGRRWVGVVGPCAIDEPGDRDDGGYIGDTGEPICAVGRKRAVRREKADVIAVEMRKQEGIDGCKSTGLETPLGVAADPLAGSTLAGRKRIAEIWRGAIDRTGIDHHGGAVWQDQQRAIAAIRGDVVDFENAGLPCGECIRNGCCSMEKFCGNVIQRGESKRAEQKAATWKHVKIILRGYFRS